MKRLAGLLTVFAALACGLPAAAQAPAPAPTARTYHHTAIEHKVLPMTFANPANPKNNPGVMSGQGCMSGRGANAAAQTVDPVTGKPRAATFVSIPVTQGGGSVASATARTQQAQACAHTR